MYIKQFRYSLDNLGYLIYAGHDYVKTSVAVARQFEPDNPNLDIYLKK